MYKKILLTVFICSLSTQLFAQIKFHSGLTLNGGFSHAWNEKLNTKLPVINDVIGWGGEFNPRLGYNVALLCVNHLLSRGDSAV